MIESWEGAGREASAERGTRSAEWRDGGKLECWEDAGEREPRKFQSSSFRFRDTEGDPSSVDRSQQPARGEPDNGCRSAAPGGRMRCHIHLHVAIMADQSVT